MRLTILLHCTLLTVFCCGCPCNLGPFETLAETWAGKTLDIRDSRPALVFEAKRPVVLKMLRDMGADDFRDKSSYGRSA